MARLRHVYPADEVAHLWAHGVDRDVRNPQGNIYTRGSVIYSYGSHFPIAQRLMVDVPQFEVWTEKSRLGTYSTRADAMARVSNMRDGGLIATVKRRTCERVVFLLTDRTYSSTTSMHVSTVRSAARGNGYTFVLDPVFWNSCYIGASGVELRKLYSQRVADAMADVNNSRMGYWNRSNAVQRTQAQLREFRDLCLTFRFRIRNGIPVPTYPDLSDAEAKQTARDALREQRRAERWARQSAEMQKAREERFERDKARKAEALQALDGWRNGHTMRYDLRLMLPFPAIRIRNGNVETTMGATVPLAECRTFFLDELPRLLGSLGERFPVTLGEFRGVTATQKSLNVGCHFFPWDEVQRFADTVGLPTLELPVE